MDHRDTGEFPHFLWGECRCICVSSPNRVLKSPSTGLRAGSQTFVEDPAKGLAPLHSPYFIGRSSGAEYPSYGPTPEMRWLVNPVQETVYRKCSSEVPVGCGPTAARTWLLLLGKNLTNSGVVLAYRRMVYLHEYGRAYPAIWSRSSGHKSASYLLKLFMRLSPPRDRPTGRAWRVSTTGVMYRGQRYIRRCSGRGRTPTPVRRIGWPVRVNAGTTLVRRRISLLRRSCHRFWTRSSSSGRVEKLEKAWTSGPIIVRREATEWCRTGRVPICTMVATHGWARLGTRVSRLVMKWVRYGEVAPHCGDGASESLMSVRYHHSRKASRSLVPTSIPMIAINRRRHHHAAVDLLGHGVRPPADVQFLTDARHLALGDTRPLDQIVQNRPAGSQPANSLAGAFGYADPSLVALGHPCAFSILSTDPR